MIFLRQILLKWEIEEIYYIFRNFLCYLIFKFNVELIVYYLKYLETENSARLQNGLFYFFYTL